MTRLGAAARVGLIMLVVAFVGIAGIYLLRPGMLPNPGNAAAVNPTTELIAKAA